MILFLFSVVSAIGPKPEEKDLRDGGQLKEISINNILPRANDKPAFLITSQIDQIKLKAKNYNPQPVVVDDEIIFFTNFGNIKFKFYNNDSPSTCLNFKKLANSTFYDNTLFHYVVPNYIIQGGDILSRDQFPENDGEGGPGWEIDAEYNNLKHKRGVLSMVRGKNPDSAGSQFFISLNENKNLNDKYTIFAYMIDGDKVLSRISSISSENDQARLLCKKDIPNKENVDDWVKVYDPKTKKYLFSKVQVGVSKSDYEQALQKRLNNKYRPGVYAVIDSIRIN